MHFETDLILEATELWQNQPGDPGKLEGIVTHQRTELGLPVTEVEVLNQQGAQAVGKPVGRYLTIELERRAQQTMDSFQRGVEVLARELRNMLPQGNGGALVVGLGNRNVTPDAVGPWTVDSVVVTRHLVQRFPDAFGDFRPVSAVATGVLGTTGVESGELVVALCERIQPTVVIAIDALAARSPDRLCNTIQLANSGIVPGSGVGNARFALNQETLGLPVLAVGVPTVIRASVLAQGRISGLEDWIVTPKDIDASASELSRMIGFGVTKALQEQLSVEEIRMMLG